MTTKHIVAVYLHDRAYGGPEEGGWWFESGDLVRVMRVFGSEASATDFCYRLNRRLRATLNRGRRSIGSVLSEGRFCARVYEDDAPPHYPARRPYYE